MEMAHECFQPALMEVKVPFGGSACPFSLKPQQSI